MTNRLATRLLYSLNSQNLEEVGAKLVRLARGTSDAEAHSCWDPEAAPVVLSLSLDSALAPLSKPDVYLVLWERFLACEESHRQHHGLPPPPRGEGSQVQQWLTEECQSCWADMVDDMSKHAVLPLVDLCGRLLAGRKVHINGDSVPEELVQRIALKRWELRSLVVREERLAQDELIGLRWVWKRQHIRLAWVTMCAAMARRGLVSLQLSVEALRSLLLVIGQLHAMHIRAKRRCCGSASSATVPSDDEGGLPGRGEAEKTVQRIEEEMLDLVLVLFTLQRDHLLQWQGLLHTTTTITNDDQLPSAEDVRWLLERSLTQVVALASDPRLCARAQPVLIEAAGTSALLLATSQARSNLKN